jgi:hypothetical protein
MPADFEFLSATDKPALLALSTMEWLATAQTVLAELGYKVHTAAGPEDFTNRFAAVQYQVVVIEEMYSCASAAENVTLKSIQVMPMPQRRHCVFILLGDSFQTMNPMQAYQQSVHGVVHRDDLLTLGAITQKCVGDNDTFLRTYRDTMQRMAEGKA